MKLTLNQSMFVRNEYVVAYALRSAKFIIVDESYASGSALADVNRMVCVIQLFDDVGTLMGETFACLVIGLGDANIAITTDDPLLRGKVMSKDNMSSCVVELYE